jgi:hypothetical protein
MDLAAQVSHCTGCARGPAGAFLLALLRVGGIFMGGLFRCADLTQHGSQGAPDSLANACLATHTMFAACGTAQPLAAPARPHRMRSRGRGSL